MVSQLSFELLEPRMDIKDYFEDAFEGSLTNYLCVIASTVGIILNSSLLYFIIQYEKCGCDVQRNVLSKLFRSACASGLEWFAICQSVDTIRFFYGPLPDFFCLVHVTFKNVVFMQIFLFYSMATVFRWIIIFKVKNLQGFNDDFWAQFTDLWVVVVSVLFQTVFILLPGRQPINYYICSGRPPEMNLAPKFNPTVSFLPLLSILVQIAVQSRIYFYKREVQMGPKSAFPLKDLKNMGQDSITLFSSRLLNVSAISLTSFAIAKVNSLQPEVLRVYPSSMYIYLLYFVAPSIVGLCAFIYVILNQSMRRSIFTEIMQIIGIRKCIKIDNQNTCFWQTEE